MFKRGPPGVEEFLFLWKVQLKMCLVPQPDSTGWGGGKGPISGFGVWGIGVFH